MKIVTKGAALILAATWVVACAAPTDDTSGDGDGDGDATGPAVPGTGGTTAATGGTTAATGGTTAVTGGTTAVTGGTTSTGGTPTTSTCGALAPGAQDTAEQWWAGSSDESGVPGADNKSIAGDAIPGQDPTMMWATGWANVSYAFGADGACVDASSSTSVSVTVDTAISGNFRVALTTSASETSSNHYQVTQMVTAGSPTTFTLNLDGSNITPSWEPADGPFDRGNLLQVVVIPRTEDAAGLSAYDFTVSNVTVN